MNTSNPFASISVIIPAYNPGRYLVEALESVQSQTLAPLETIIVDDGSSPPVRIPEHVKLPIRLIRQKNSGQAAARNMAMEQARGEWLAFLDADDIWHPRKLEKQWAQIRQQPDLGVIGCRGVLIDQAGKVIGVGPGGFSGRGTPLSRGEFLEQAALAVLIPSMALVKTAAVVPDLRFERRFQPIEDLVFFDRLFARGNAFRVVEMPLLKRRVHEESLTLRFREMLQSYLHWEEMLIRPELGTLVGQKLRSSAYLVTGLSALAKQDDRAARALLKRGFGLLGDSRFLVPFLLACLGSRSAVILRKIKRLITAHRGQQLWNADLAGVE